MAISKFSPNGSNLIYSTFLGGNNGEIITSMVVDRNLNLIVLGVTSSANFPTSSNAYDRTFASSNSINFNSGYNVFLSNGADIVISKFDLNGRNLLGSTYLGGNGPDGLNYNPLEDKVANFDLVYNYGDHFRGEVITDQSNNIYIGSSSRSNDLDTTKNKNSGNQDGIIAKFSPDLDQLLWLRHHGGSSTDAIYSLKVIDSNKVLVGGGTMSYSDFPVGASSYQTVAGGGRAEGFISIISANGDSVENSTYIGTSNYDQVYFIEHDRLGNIYGMGQSLGQMPNSNTAVSDNSGQFIIKLDPNLDSALFEHTFGDEFGNGDINISPTAFLVDRCFNLYVSGWGGSIFTTNQQEGLKTLPNTMRITNDAFRSNTLDNQDFYIYVANRLLDRVIYASYIGNPDANDHVDGGTSRFDKEGVIYQSVCASCGVTPTSTSDEFPTSQGSYARRRNFVLTNTNTVCNNALFKLDLEVLPDAGFFVENDTICAGDSIRIFDTSTGGDVIEYDFYGTTVFTNNLDTVIAFPNAGSYFIGQVVEDTICLANDGFATTIKVRPNNLEVTTTADTTLCYNDSAYITAFTNGTANQFRWSRSPNFNTSVVTSDSIFGVQLPNIGENKYYVQVENTITNACEKIDSITIKYFPTQADINISKDSTCEDLPVNITSTYFNVDSFSWRFGNGSTNSIDSALSYIYSTPNDYELEFIYRNDSCTISDTLRLNLFVQENQLRIDSLNDSLFCGPTDFEVSQNSFGTAEQFIWSSDSTFSDTLNSSPRDSSISIDNLGEDEYFIKLVDGFCSAEDMVNLEFIRYQLDWDSIPALNCTGISEEVNTTIIGTDSFRINFGNGSFTTTDSTPQLVYNSIGIYNIELIGSNARCGFNDTLTQSIEIFQNVSLQSSDDTLICSGDTITLTTNSFGNANTFSWDTIPNFPSPINPNGDSTISIFPNTDQTYYVLGESGICSDRDTVQIQTEIVEVEVDENFSICFEDTISIPARLINSINPVNYSWEPQDSIITGSMSNLITVSPQQNIQFFLESTSSIGCKDFDTTEVEVEIPAFDDALISASNDSIFNGEIINLSTNRNGGNLIYLWEPSGIIDNPNSPNPNANPTKDTTIKVTITDMNTGCEVEAFKRIKVYEINCGEPDIFIPSAFTPNRDGNNDIFYVRGANLDEIQLNLYNRWGELVFETTDKNKGWDGIYKGKKTDPGVFVYHLKATCFDGQEFFKKGNVSLIR
jgi:gliding motility-associated-like protein